MRVYGYFGSSSSYRCRIAFNLKGVAYDLQAVDLKAGKQADDDFIALNPQKMLPALVMDDGAVLTQSLAILEWLEEVHPDPALLPADPVARAHVRAFAQAIACEIHPLQNLRVLSYLRDNLNADEAAVAAWLTRWLTEGLTACEALLERRATQTDFCFGDQPGMADICLVPQVFSAQRFGVDISHLRRITDIHARCEALPAFAAAHPANQPDVAP